MTEQGTSNDLWDFTITQGLNGATLPDSVQSEGFSVWVKAPVEVGPDITSFPGCPHTKVYPLVDETMRHLTNKTGWRWMYVCECVGQLGEKHETLAADDLDDEPAVTGNLFG